VCIVWWVYAAECGWLLACIALKIEDYVADLNPLDKCLAGSYSGLRAIHPCNVRIRCVSDNETFTSTDSTLV
jgi:hypothetical protein